MANEVRQIELDDTVADTYQPSRDAGPARTIDYTDSGVSQTAVAGFDRSRGGHYQKDANNLVDLKPEKTFDQFRDEFCAWEPVFSDAGTVSYSVGGKTYTADNFKVIANSATGAALSTVKDGKRSKYTIQTNRANIDSCIPIIESGKAAIVDCGHWGNGERSYIKMHTKVQREIVPGEGPTFLEIGIYPKIDGSQTVACRTIRRVCLNGMMAVSGNGQLKFTLPHFKNVEKRQTQIMALVDEYISQSGEVFDRLESLAKIRCTGKVWNDLMETLYPHKDGEDENGNVIQTLSTRSENIRESMRWHARHAAGARVYGAPTLYDALQGVTAFYNHGSQIVAGQNAKTYQSPELNNIRRGVFNPSLVDGADSKKMVKAYNYLMDLAA